jgi:hypothetical protein
MNFQLTKAQNFIAFGAQYDSHFVWHPVNMKNIQLG